MQMSSVDTGKKTREVWAISLDTVRDEKEIREMELSRCQLLVNFRGRYFKLFGLIGENPVAFKNKELSHLLKVIISENSKERKRIEVLEILKGSEQA